MYMRYANVPTYTFYIEFRYPLKTPTIAFVTPIHFGT